jgi:hypothetical protein
MAWVVPNPNWMEGTGCQAPPTRSACVQLSTGYLVAQGSVLKTNGIPVLFSAL